MGQDLFDPDWQLIVSKTKYLKKKIQSSKEKNIKISGPFYKQSVEGRV